MRLDNSIYYCPGQSVPLPATPQTIRRAAPARLEQRAGGLIVACRIAALLLLIVLAGSGAARAQPPPNQRTSDLTNLSLDRTPSRAEEGARVNVAVIPAPDGTLTYVWLFGDRAFKSEELNAYEAGYRVRATDKLFLRVAAFRNLYGRYRTQVERSVYGKVTWRS